MWIVQHQAEVEILQLVSSPHLLPDVSCFLTEVTEAATTGMWISVASNPTRTWWTSHLAFLNNHYARRLTPPCLIYTVQMCQLRCLKLSITSSLKLNTAEWVEGRTDGRSLPSFVWTENLRVSPGHFCTFSDSFKDRRARLDTHPETRPGGQINSTGKKLKRLLCSVTWAKGGGEDQSGGSRCLWPPGQTNAGLPAPLQS